MERVLTAEETMALLRENASCLAAATHGQPATRLHAAPEPGAWSANDVLAHLRACCDVWGENMTRILAEDHPTLAGRSPRTYMARTDYPAWPFEEAWRAFVTQREALLATLDALTPEEWERAASVTSYGQVHQRTLRSYASYLAEHEKSHVAQIERGLGEVRSA